MLRGAWSWLEPPDWDRIVSASPAATGFHARGWLEAMAAWQPRFEARALGLALADGARLALPMLVRRGALRRGPFGRGVSSHPSTYGGPVCAERLLTETDWETFLDLLARAPLGRIECFGNPLQPLPPAAESRVGVREGETHVIELESLPAAAREGYPPACRRAVRKAEREGVTVARSSDPAGVGEYHALHRESVARWGQTAEQALPPGVLERLVHVPGVELWCARGPDGRLAAGGLFLFARAHVVYWHGALCAELAGLRPANLLHDALIEEARRRGARLYDFNPSAGLEGVRAFKESFGARPLRFAIWRHRHPWIALLAGRGRRGLTAPRR
jgi:CelD/BcsL family acetyltransferase involved in cellulose biosynthesis